MKIFCLILPLAFAMSCIAAFILFHATHMIDSDQVPIVPVLEKPIGARTENNVVDSAKPIVNINPPLTREENTYENVLIVLGNEPLDSNTPTVDTISRVKRAVHFVTDINDPQPSSLLIFSGGPTAGLNSEAEMMQDIAFNVGYSSDLASNGCHIALEKQARSTQENAIYAVKLLHDKRMKFQKLFVVSKEDHLSWAMPLFQQVQQQMPRVSKDPEYKNIFLAFENAKPLSCTIAKEESIQQMKTYLITHNNQRVDKRLHFLKHNIKGID